MGFSWGPPPPDPTLGRAAPPRELEAGICCAGCPNPGYRCPRPDLCPPRMARRHTIHFHRVDTPAPTPRRPSLWARLFKRREAPPT
jgi:hypothetical protein